MKTWIKVALGVGVLTLTSPTLYASAQAAPSNMTELWKGGWKNFYTHQVRPLTEVESLAAGDMAIRPATSEEAGMLASHIIVLERILHKEVVEKTFYVKPVEM